MFKKGIKNNLIFSIILIFSVLGCTEKKESFPDYIDEIILDFERISHKKSIGVLIIPGRQKNKEFELYCYTFNPKTTKLNSNDRFLDSSHHVILFYRHIDVFSKTHDFDTATNNIFNSNPCDILPIIGYYYIINNKLKITQRREIELESGVEKYFYPFIDYQ